MSNKGIPISEEGCNIRNPDGTVAGVIKGGELFVDEQGNQTFTGNIFSGNCFVDDKLVAMNGVMIDEQ